MWTISTSTRQYDLCGAMAAQLVRGEAVTVTRVTGTASLPAAGGGRTEVILPSAVTRLRRIQALNATCDEHGSACP